MMEPVGPGFGSSCINCVHRAAAAVPPCAHSGTMHTGNPKGREGMQDCSCSIPRPPEVQSSGSHAMHTRCHRGALTRDGEGRVGVGIEDGHSSGVGPRPGRAVAVQPTRSSRGAQPPRVRLSARPPRLRRPKRAAGCQAVVQVGEAVQVLHGRATCRVACMRACPYWLHACAWRSGAGPAWPTGRVASMLMDTDVCGRW